MDRLQFRAKLPFQRGVDDGERLVEKNRRDVGANKAASERNLLLGVGGEATRAAIEIAGQIEHLRDFGDALVDHRLWKATIFQGKG